jgi:enterochelin esterase-like enzyme
MRDSGERRGRKSRLGTQTQAQVQNYLPGSGYESPRLRKHAGFRSRILRASRDVTVYLPPGYEEGTQRDYPLMIMHDGQNLFDPETSFVRGHTWRIAEAADEGIAAGEVEPVIIAGVANGGEKRLAEYTPSRDWKMGGGDAGKYGEMLTRELLPFLRSEYRVRSAAEQTGIGGSSLGGLVSLWLGLRYPDTFGRLAVMSPSVWWNHKYIVSYVNDTAPELKRRPKIWLDVGDAEGRRTLADAELLAARLKLHGWREDADLHFERAAGGKHDEDSWAMRVGPMLRFLYPPEQQ